jgi:hypothetical protein
MQAYHDLGIGAPAYYALEYYRYLRERNPRFTDEAAIRECNIDNGLALVREVETAYKKMTVQHWQQATRR